MTFQCDKHIYFVKCFHKNNPDFPKIDDSGNIGNTDLRRGEQNILSKRVTLGTLGLLL